MTRTRRKYQNRKRVVNDSGQTDEKDALISHEKVDTNADVLPARPKGSKKSKKNEPKDKQLSRKERRKLEQIVKRKAVKQQRSEIIDALQKVQVSAEHTRYMVSTTTVYNGGDFSQLQASNTDSTLSQTQFVRSSLRGANKQKKLQRSESQSESESDSESVATSAMSTDSEVEREVDEIDHRNTNQEAQATVESELQQVDSSVVAHEEPMQEITANATDAAGVVSIEATDKAQEEALKRIRKLFNVPVSRTEAVEVARRRLPIVGEEQAVMEAVNAHRVTIVCGETGSGKTTQVPQFLYEAGYASGAYRIAVTEPRRIAAISMSQRVAHELNGDSSLVGYRIRYESNVTPATRIIFMTDGVLLKEVQKDFLLRDYSVVVLDEVHERSVFTDILIGLLSRIVRVREKRGEPLKLVLMSATLRVSDFTDNRRLFSEPPPTLNIATRQFSVAVHFNRRTPPRTEYVSAAFRKVIKVHSTLPEGGVLVFVATANDVRALCAMLRKANERAEAKRLKMEETQATTQSGATPTGSTTDAEVNLDCVSALPERPTKLVEPAQDNASASQRADDDVQDEQQDVDVNPDEDDPEAEEHWLAKNAVFPEPMHVLPLYSLLPTAEQLRVFEPAPAGTRLVVIATNVAETSLTIPGIKYVVDSGLVKRKYYEKTLGISQFRIEWCSKASANQRAGRAGRVGPGHAYRLYSSAVFGDFAEFSEPEILERPLDDIVLQTKALGIDNVENFPFPNAPSTKALREAERVLLALGAVKPLDSQGPSESLMAVSKHQQVTVSRISELGERLAAFSVSPRCAKLLVLATQFDILDYAVLLVAALSVPEVLLDAAPAGPNVANLRRTMLNTVEWRRLGDFGVLIKTVAAVEFTLRREGGLRIPFAASNKRVDEVCAKFAVRAKAFRELMRLRSQLRSQIDAAIGSGNAHVAQAAVKVSVDLDGRYVDAAQSCVDVEPLAPPTEKQLNLIRQCLVCVLCDHVLRRMPTELATDGDAGKRAARSSNEPRYEHMLMNDAVFVHPNSAMYAELVTSHRSGRAGSEYDYLLFGELGQNEKQTVYAKLICTVDADWLHRLCEPYCEFGLSNDTHPVRYDATRDTVLCHRPVAYGSKAWPLGLYELEFPKGVERVKQFARLLVEGEVYVPLKRFVPNLLFSPNVLIRSWCGLHARAAELVNRLLAADSIDCRSKLEAKWHSDRTFLLEEYASWLPQALYYQVRDVWPPCENETQTVK